MGSDDRLNVPEGCALYKSGDCKFPTHGLEGCVFYPIFKQYKIGHDESSELFRATTMEGMKGLRDSITKLFREIEGNGEDGIKGRLARQEEDSKALHRERKIMIRILAGILAVAILVGSGTLGMMWVQVKGLSTVETKLDNHMGPAEGGQEESHE